MSPLLDTSDGSASSELCKNKKESRIIDSFWHRDLGRGCSVQPKQVISIDPWITFPVSPHSIPVNIQSNSRESDPETAIYVLVEAKAFPIRIDPRNEDSKDAEEVSSDFEMGFPSFKNLVLIEDYGEPIAWKIDSDFAFLLKSDPDSFLKFVVATFLEGNLRINDELPLFRIQSRLFS